MVYWTGYVYGCGTIYPDKTRCQIHCSAHHGIEYPVLNPEYEVIARSIVINTEVKRGMSCRIILRDDFIALLQ